MVRQRRIVLRDEGPFEVKMIVDHLKPLIVGNPQHPTDKRKQIFSEHPHLCADNHFSGDNVMDYLGKNGFKGMFTCRRDRLPNDCPNCYFHYDKIQVSPESKVARFQQPIVAAKFVAPSTSEEKSYVRAHCSFQSTGGTNISTVNAMLEVNLYVREKSLGAGAPTNVGTELR